MGLTKTSCSNRSAGGSIRHCSKPPLEAGMFHATSGVCIRFAGSAPGSLANTIRRMRKSLGLKFLTPEWTGVNATFLLAVKRSWMTWANVGSWSQVYLKVGRETNGRLISPRKTSSPCVLKCEMWSRIQSVIIWSSDWCICDCPLAMTGNGCPMLQWETSHVNYYRVRLALISQKSLCQGILACEEDYNCLIDSNPEHLRSVGSAYDPDKQRRLTVVSPRKCCFADGSISEHRRD